ncbi:ATP-binding protein [Roseisolibacter sp. H3M3-2]|uniref:ATP-binding protein n=1 Tax=Roseisolibacter sp. H3M3-2 TaxID=3031323 RepID=UPI0023DA6E60|nr:ATP-binding protein [Roseisolibacter sp. H3M3-2]MDF1502548.1 ATP-binding protein [Roseisolibacter sp. H3M3-2]
MTGLAPFERPLGSDAEGFARAVLDALPMTIWTCDLDGRITAVNRAWARFAEANGAPRLADASAVVGRSIWDGVTDAASREQLERGMALLRAGRAPFVRWEFPCDAPDEERVFLMQLSPVRAAAGDPHAITGYVFSTVDITASHRSREALIDTGIALSRTLDLDRVFAEVAQQVRRALRGDSFCLAVADEDTAAFRVAYQYGYDRDLPAPGAADGVVGSLGAGPAAGAASPPLAERLEARLEPAWLEALANERVVLRHSERGLELTAPVMSAEGVLGAMTVRADDIESPQRLDEATRLLTTLAAQTAAAIERSWLVRRVEHKRRLEAIGEVAAGVAHELRNPLFGISSAAQLLRFRVADDPVVEKNVGRILREVERLNRMVTALLEYGRHSAAVLVPGDPEAVWDDVLDGERGRLESKRLVLVKERLGAVPPGGVSCRIDAEQLAQVFLNVLVNAVDAAPEGSDLTLSYAVLPSGAWRCRLHNGGPAIPGEVLARAFEIFYSTKPGGTGIGLALCQRIVDEHAGTIALESAPEAGTAVVITLPAA